MSLDSMVNTVAATDTAAYAAALASYITILTTGTGSSDDQTALEAAMATLGKTPDDLLRDYTVVTNAKAAAAQITGGQTALGSAYTTAVAALDTYVAASKAAIDAEIATLAALKATRRAGFAAAKTAIEALEGTAMLALKDAYPLLQKLKSQNTELLASIPLASPETLKLGNKKSFPPTDPALVSKELPNPI